MSIKVPPAYVTRPIASQLYNRSQRALERELNIALATQDQPALSQWKLITKDNTQRDANDVTRDLVKKLQNTGMVPTWYVKHSYLEQKYGKKGSPKPKQVKLATKVDQPVHDKGQDPESVHPSSPPPRAPTPDDIAFLKQLIRTLETDKEKQQERHDKLVAKLFDQLEVKDKQISSWDEITQGMARGLATGKLQPNLLAGASVEEEGGPDRVRHTTVVVDNDGPEKQGTAEKPERLSAVTKPARSTPVRNRRIHASAGSKTNTPKKPAKEEDLPIWQRDIRDIPAILLRRR